MQPRNNQTKHLTFDLTQAQTFSNHFKHKTVVKQATYPKNEKPSFPYLA